MSDLTELSDETFDAVVNANDVPVVVDFWAPWCGSCRLLMPAISALAGEMVDEVTFAKVDVDAETKLAERLGVMSIPTVIVFRAGREVARVNGVKSKSTLRDIIREHAAAA